MDYTTELKALPSFTKLELLYKSTLWGLIIIYKELMPLGHHKGPYHNTQNNGDSYDHQTGGLIIIYNFTVISGHYYK